MDKKQRKRYITTTLLQQLKAHSLFEDISIIELVSSHPAACNALAKFARKFLVFVSDLFIDCAIGVSMQHIDLKFITQNAASILTSSPIGYLRSAQLCGTLLNAADTSGAISSVFTNFPVDHQEPLEVLSGYVSEGKWLLGALLDSHEILIILHVPLGICSQDVET